MSKGFEVQFEEDGYDAYGIIQSYPLNSERYVIVNLHEIDGLIKELLELKKKIEESGVLAK